MPGFVQVGEEEGKDAQGTGEAQEPEAGRTGERAGK